MAKGEQCQLFRSSTLDGEVNAERKPRLNDQEQESVVLVVGMASF